MFEVRNLTSAYGQSQVLHGIDLSVAQGEIVALVGRNGMGKSTLMKSLIGVMPTRSGQIVVDGQRRHLAREPSARRPRPGLCSAGPPDLRHHDGEGKHRDRPGRDGQERNSPRDLRSVPGTRGLRAQARRQLSGGQQQQLAIARAAASDPKVLLLDEPTEGIQPSIIKDIARLLRDIRSVRNLCIVVCEQLLSFVLDVADRILVMEGGRIVHTDTREHVDEAAIARFLAVLISAVRFWRDRAFTSNGEQPCTRQ